MAKIRFPEPAPCGRTPLTAQSLSKSYGSLEVFTDVDLAIDRGSRVVVLGLNGAGKTTLLRMLAGVEEPDTGRVEPGHGLRARLLRAGARDTRSRAHRAGELALGLAESQRVRWPQSARVDSCSPVTPSTNLPERSPAARRPGWRWPVWWCPSANVLLLDEPTNNLDPASREEILAALRRYAGAIVLVTHDEGAVEALDPERLILLPDGVEDLWSADYADLISLA